MNTGWKYTAAGALGGAVIALVLVIGLGAAGILPIHLTERARDEAVRGYLMAHPEVLADASTELQTRQDAAEIHAREAAVAKVGLKAFFNPKIAFLTGPADAKTTLAEFFDYNCPYCRASVPALKKFYEAHKKDTRFAFIEFPIKGANSELAARAAIAARKQPDKYLTFHFLLMGEHELVTPEVVFADAKKAGLDLGKLSADMKDPSVDEAIKAAHALAEKTGINATPTFILNGRVRPGAIDDKMLTQMLES
jgi:protein-disulfide isomerase